MDAGHVTGQSILRFISGASDKQSRHYTHEDIDQLNIDPDRDGWPLNVPYSGLAPLLDAHLCRECRKVFCQMDIFIPRKEEAR